MHRKTLRRMMLLVAVGSLFWVAYFAMRPQDGGGGLIPLLVLVLAIGSFLATAVLLVYEMRNPPKRHEHDGEDNGSGRLGS